jgi:hypothetical protein
MHKMNFSRLFRARIRINERIGKILALVVRKLDRLAHTLGLIRNAIVDLADGGVSARIEKVILMDCLRFNDSRNQSSRSAPPPRGHG